MGKRARKILVILAATGVVINSKYIKSGILVGMEQCALQVIPALFPFLILSGFLTENIDLTACSRYSHSKNTFIPLNSLPFFFQGIIGGYPVGAQAIQQAYRKKCITKPVAAQMLGFCNNAGPAFILGMGSGLFINQTIPWILWSIQILSAVITAHTTKFVYSPEQPAIPKRNLRLSVIEQSIKSIVIICAWIVIFRSILSVLFKYIPLDASNLLYPIICGVLELTNGTIALQEIHSEALRFVLFSSFLSFGGVCVWLQVFSIIQELPKCGFIFGKLKQASLSTIIALVLQFFIFSQPIDVTTITKIGIPAVLSTILIHYIGKIYVEKK